LGIETCSDCSNVKDGQERTHGELVDGSGGLDVDEVLLEVDDGLLDLGGRGGGERDLETERT
jgi:hypothetical protein